MKYRIKKIVHKKRNKGSVVEFSTLFDFGIFCEKEENKTVPYRKRVSKARLVFAAFTLRLSRFFSAVRARLAERLARIWARPENRMILPSLCGALVAVSLVALFSFSIVGYKLLYQNYFGSYKKVAVPDFSGLVYPNDEIFQDLDYCNLTLSFEYDDSAPAGTVISQTPAPKLVRRVYRKKSNCNVELVVSLGKKTLVMPGLLGETLRDARLALNNLGVSFSVDEAYSSEVEKGRIISTFPSENDTFYADMQVTLTVSLGEKKTLRTVPNIVGMNESRAREAIEAAGLKVGKVSYESSDKGYGIVLWQSVAAYSSAEDSSTVSFSVSAGRDFFEKKIPDLHSLSVNEAREKLAEVGIVLGRVYSVANAAKSGTVVAQFPPANTAITSDIYSVDVYVSQ